MGTAGAPLPVTGRGGISSAVAVDGRVFVVDCGRGSPSAFAEAGLDFTRLEAVFRPGLTGVTAYRGLTGVTAYRGLTSYPAAYRRLTRAYQGPGSNRIRYVSGV